MKCAVIIAAYNADKYILDCYESVKNQILHGVIFIFLRGQIENIHNNVYMAADRTITKNH